MMTMPDRCPECGGALDEAPLDEAPLDVGAAGETGFTETVCPKCKSVIRAPGRRRQETRHADADGSPRPDSRTSGQPRRRT